MSEKDSNLPQGLSKPAQRALSGAGITRLEQLTEMTEAKLLELHGFGPKSIELLRHALTQKGLSFAIGPEG
jgi:DNA-directed RNA polymerase alpha subunit